MVDYVPSIDEYYESSSWAYRFFYNKNGYIHLGISDWEGYGPGPEAALEYISDYIIKNKVHSVLELGYGMGSNLAYLSKKHRNVMFVGVDRANHPLKRNAGGGNVEHLKGDFHEIGRLLDRRFDLVLAIEAICYSPRLDIVDKIAEILNPGGTLIVFDIYNHTERILSDEEERARSACAHSVGIDSFIDCTFAIERFSERFNSIASLDLSQNAMKSLERMENIAAFYFRHPYLTRIFNMFYPSAFTRNSILGLLLPACLRNRTLCYRMDVLRPP